MLLIANSCGYLRAKMGSLPILSSLIICHNNHPSTPSFNATHPITFYGSNPNILSSLNKPRTAINIRPSSRASAVNDIPTVAAQSEITWEIVVGALAGVAPFVVAGIEFNKRIVAQKKCKVCKGSGLVLRDKYYFRCPACGGFLPWQSWRRFFTG